MLFNVDDRVDFFDDEIKEFNFLRRSVLDLALFEKFVDRLQLRLEINRCRSIIQDL